MKSKQQGQISIFIALIFQVIFVFFAMVINIGLMVHDKINLQNSVDLAAYYGAQRQAEILDAIAHSNYQIRQAWKLLTYRIRVIGNFGDAGHPSNPARLLDNSDQEWPNAREVGGRINVSVCLTFRAWRTESRQLADRLENLCSRASGFRLPRFPQPGDVEGGFPWDANFRRRLGDLGQAYDSQCRGKGPFNWIMAVRWLHAFRVESGIRHETIEAMANLLQNGNDLQGNSIEEGVRKNLNGNLTQTNREAVSNFEFFNSMSGVEKREWLPIRLIYPLILYKDIDGSGNCTVKIRGVSELPDNESINTSAELQAAVDALRIFRFEPSLSALDDGPAMIQHSSAGVEKNPWYKVYVGVKATTNPRKAFAAFGRAVSLEARSFAAPFGGRIGPWRFDRWAPTAFKSDGDPIDPLLPPDYDPEALTATGPTFSYEHIPNYSRFPGDQVGVSSMLSLSLARSFLPGPSAQFFVEEYDHLPFSAQNGEENALAVAVGGGTSLLRNLELLAIAPDLFDITYYSIQPEFFRTYAQRAINAFGDGVRILADLGSLPNQPAGITQQVGSVQGAREFNQVYYTVNDINHLLTSWVPNRIINYEFPADKFGRCFQNVDENMIATQGSCVMGGRSGYSVKLYSRDYLTSGELPLGGGAQDPAVGALRNPPPNDF